MSGGEQSLLSVLGSIAGARPHSSTEADGLAAANWRANRASIGRAQPNILAEIDSVGPIGMTWIFARDGALTAQDESDRWWGKCSVPRAATRALLREFVAKGTVQCYLDPLHASEIAGALAAISTHQAVVAIVPDAWRLGVMLRCEDFSAAIDKSRLWFVTGHTWARQLESLLELLPGLPIPTQFIKTVFANEAGLPAMVEAAQGVFSRQTQKRGILLDEIRAASSASETKTAPRDVLVVAPSRFGLWGIAGYAMERALVAESHISSTTDHSWNRLDPDHPTSASPLGLAMAAAECGSIVTADTGRADAPGVVSKDSAWITWITGPRVPAYDAGAPRDGLLVADEAWIDIAVRGGWPKDRIAVAGWPSLFDKSQPAATATRLGLIADITELEPPVAETNLSSQRLLWEFIRDELIRDPAACDGDPLDYLSARMRKFAVGEESLNRVRFIDELILPAYAIGLARLLIDNGLPVKVWGSGWEKRAQFAERTGGPIRSISDLSAAAGECKALVHAWPTTWAHPIDALGCPVIRRRGRGTDGIIRSAWAAMNVSAGNGTVAAAAALSRESLCRVRPRGN
jgi:hypothetical protein